MAPRLKRFLDDRALRYELVNHPVTHNSRETAMAADVDADRLAKAVLVESEARRLLVVIPAAHRLELGSVHRALGVEVGLATRLEVERTFEDCVDGAVPAAGQAYGLEVLVDDALLEAGDVYFEAGDRTELVKMSGAEFRALMSSQPHGAFSVHAPRRGA
ncbi:MAG TPA: YbaK/EbsC family protein [Gammaproteobacteria bacterium]|nr:YbaK/EbsC family protein [Gammaproteobacteria bacterium]